MSQVKSGESVFVGGGEGEADEEFLTSIKNVYSYLWMFTRPPETHTLGTQLESFCYGQLISLTIFKGLVRAVISSLNRGMMAVFDLIFLGYCYCCRVSA